MVKLSGKAVKERLQSPGGCKKRTRNIVSSSGLFSCCNLHLGTEKAVRSKGQSWCMFHLIIKTQIRALRISAFLFPNHEARFPLCLPFNILICLPNLIGSSSHFTAWHSRLFLTILFQSFPSLVCCPHFTKLTVGILSGSNYILSLAEV